MDSGLDERLAQVIARHREQKARREEATPKLDRERRRTRERVLAELSHLVSRISHVIAELNDQVADEGIIIVLSSAEHQAAAEAAYSLTLADDAASDPRMLLNIDWSGVAHAVLCSGDARSLVFASSIFDLDKSRIRELILRLLEARFP